MPAPSIYTLGPSTHPKVQNLGWLKRQWLDVSIDFSLYERLILSSKTVVEALEQLDASWKQIPVMAIGPATAEKAKEKGAQVLFTHDGSGGESFAKAVIPLLQNKKALYVRGREVAFDIGSYLQKQKGLDVASEIVYATECECGEQAFATEADSVIIFTSPKTVECFFRCQEWQEHFHAVCIGQTTARALPEHIDGHVPGESTLDASVSLAERLLSA